MTFSQRHGPKPEPSRNLIRGEAPEEFRLVLLTLAELLGIRPQRVHNLICQILLRKPDLESYDDEDVENENETLLKRAPWHRIYDVAEALSSEHKKQQMFVKDDIFDRRLDEFFVEKGYGWKIENSEISVRGSEAFEHSVSTAVGVTKSSNRPTAGNEIQEALSDLSRRPSPDLTGAIHHAMNALECVARDIDGSSDTLGKIVARLELPKPLDTGLEKLWGFASQKGRHILEGEEPKFEDAELVVTLASAITTFLIRRQPNEASAEK
jgi:AbiJ N-terminal domain 4